MSMYVRSRKFCCFLPVRFGVFVLSLVAMLGGSFIAAIGWMQVSQLSQHPLERNDEVALYVHCSVFTFLGVLGALGFIGSLVKSKGLVMTFGVGVAIHLAFSIAAGVFNLYTMFHENSAEAITKCLNGATDDATREVCNNGIAIIKGVAVAIYIISWLIELYAYFIVERYIEQLDEEEDAKRPPVMPQISNPRMISAPDYLHFHEPRPETGYAFTQPRQAYGVSRGQDASNMA